MNMNTPFGQFWKECGDIVVGVGLVLAVSALSWKAVEVRSERDSAAMAEATQFVNVSMEQCRKAQSTDNECANGAIKAAHSFRGESFARAVSSIFAERVLRTTS